jgi:hypothetical protein
VRRHRRSRPILSLAGRCGSTCRGGCFRSEELPGDPGGARFASSIPVVSVTIGIVTHETIGGAEGGSILYSGGAGLIALIRAATPGGLCIEIDLFPIIFFHCKVFSYKRRRLTGLAKKARFRYLGTGRKPLTPRREP